ncbi:MAG: M50 family metallopeptidase [Candidatus Roizmanbacteria bacterium]|nr:M50 family metallopeptidase [Candidatus Roizmanbacteria bacterium]
MILTILTFAIILIILVVIHEAGHFFAAKLMGIKVEEFGFGLPPRAWGKKIGETIYSLNWLPIGGFVRLYGEDAMHPETVKKERSRAFFAKKPWQRSIVLTAGVTMNFLLGWLLIAYLFNIGLPVPTGNVKVIEALPDSPAEKAGIQSEDIIQSLSTPTNKTISLHTIQELVNVLQKYPDTEVTVNIQRDNTIEYIRVTPKYLEDTKSVGIGVVISDSVIEQYSTIPDRITHGFSYSIYLIKATIEGLGDTLKKLFTGDVKNIQVGGIILIGQAVGEARKVGTDSLLYLVGFLSLNLALINALPIPALDGGHLIFVLFEGITGKKMKPQWETNLHQIGMIFLLLLMVLITINDILRLRAG